MNIEHFQTSPAGKLLRVVEGEMAYWAFVPQPLPPALDADWELVGHLSVADCMPSAALWVDGRGVGLHHQP